MLTFKEWYCVHYNEKWQEEYDTMDDYITQVIEQYEDYCKKYNIAPIWHG